MGKKSARGRSRRGGGGGRGGGTWRDYPAVPKANANFERFYDALLELPDEEKQVYWDALKRELPNSFRFCGSKGHALSVKALLQARYIPDIIKIENHDGSAVEPPMPVPWYPDELAWWMTTPKNVVRKSPPFAAFQKFLVSETSIGNISRQEVVSMIPPLFMDLRPGMTVLDMCAAPGSKSAQLLEMIHGGEEARMGKVLRSFAAEDGLELGTETLDEMVADIDADPSDCGRATGLLIANDADYKRGHMLVHQLKRLSSPNLIVTNHDATQFPSIKLPSTDSASSTKPVFLKFDRILADVPCSGDGTIRKNANLWKDWQPGNALGLHATQVRILVRALQLLAIGGRVVYSTCSMNPVENESVIASAIERCGGKVNVEIVDCGHKLRNLKRRPGMKTWKIMDKSGRIWDTWQQVETFARDENKGVVPGRVVQSMFPRLEGCQGFDLPLDRCMRVYPHLQDTGGFFIAVLEKKSDFRAKNEKEAKQMAHTHILAEKVDGMQAKSEDVRPEAAREASQGQNAEPAVAEVPSTNGKRPLEETGQEERQAVKKTKTGPTDDAAAEASTPASEPVPSSEVTSSKAKRNGPPEEPFKFLDASHPVILDIKKFYRISARFPDNRYMVRNEMGEPAKAIYYTTALARDILRENEGRGVRFVHGGVRMFMKQDAPSAEVCRWRIQAEGMPILQGYVGEPRVLHLRNKETLRKLLIEMFPRISDGAWKNFDEIGQQVRDVGMGCCVLRVEPDGSDPDFTERMALPLWKSIHSLNLMLPKEDRSAMLLRIFNDTTPLVNMGLNKNKTSAAQQDKQPQTGNETRGDETQTTAEESIGDDADAAQSAENRPLAALADVESGPADEVEEAS